jgi:uncharacterized protein YuzE
MVLAKFDPKVNIVYIGIKRGDVKVSESLSDDIIVDFKCFGRFSKTS